ncbi:MAG: SMC family ATPase, partial [Oscillospiraceae bacterium]|nr:SMC family ATPase [Oscillospiraceae bacterium]
MKPICLELTAFGSYAEATTLPFDALTHGLYLVTGDTGAGKTTLFDGIVFALYGQASGRDRNPAMMHCDFVEKSVDTVVKLTFSQNRKRYSVTRSIHFPKKRKGVGGYGDPEIQALLTGDGLSPVEGASRVTAACEALLGLNAEQFRKIVMLAQGEFRDFLKADSEKKNEILGKLFDSSAYLWYQRLFEGAWHKLEEDRAAEREGLRALLETRLSLPPDADSARFLPDEPELLGNLEALLEQTRSEFTALEEALRNAEARRDKLLVQKTEGTARNEALDRLETGKASLSALEAQAEEIAQRKTALERAETALHLALPPLREAERTARERDAARESTAKLQTLLTQRESAYLQAVAQREQDGALHEQKDAISALLTELDRQLSLYADLKRSQQALMGAKQEHGNCLTRQSTLLQKLELETTRRGQLQQRLEALADIDLRLDQARRDDADVERIQGKLDEIQKRCEALKTRRLRLVENDTAFQTFTRQVLAAQSHYNDLYRRFLTGQAGLLAEELRRAVAAEGEGRCPVCGSQLKADDLSRLPEHCEETPSKEVVDAAKQQAEALEQSRQQKKELLDLAHSQFHAKRELLVNEALQLCPGCEDWESLSAPGFLEACAAEFAARRDAAARTLAVTEANARERDTLRQSLAKAEQTAAELQAGLDDLQSKLTEQVKLLSAAEQSVAMLQAQLRYPNEIAAKAEADRLRTAYSDLVA